MTQLVLHPLLFSIRNVHRSKTAFFPSLMAIYVKVERGATILSLKNVQP